MIRKLHDIIEIGYVGADDPPYVVGTDDVLVVEEHQV